MTKKICVLFFSLCFSFMYAQNVDDVSQENVEKEVVLDAIQREVTVDDVFTIVANILPKEADQKVTWHLSQPGILDMIGYGQFKALKAGDLTITATAQDGSGVKAVCRGTVKGEWMLFEEAREYFFRIPLLCNQTG